MAGTKNLLLLILGSACVSVSISSRPRIFLENGTEAPDEITVPARGNFSLTCRDVQPVQWRLHYDLHISHAIDCEDQENEELPYCVSIMITNINYTDVGFFPCVHNTSSNWVETYQFHPDYKDAQAVYVFVKDEKYLLVPTNIVINGEMNKPLLVPCKPTFPAVHVSISKLHDQETNDFLTMVRIILLFNLIC
ncbi:unnamed protein product [Meganyctiphanes norvegica]|uniref:Uncharacterized protein n=1 Tax=Meganyctiphanes norvegica TaxID=48144 RepID=A0AAV2RSR2_MEGNR